MSVSCSESHFLAKYLLLYRSPLTHPTTHITSKAALSLLRRALCVWTRKRGGDKNRSTFPVTFVWNRKRASKPGKRFHRRRRARCRGGPGISCSSCKLSQFICLRGRSIQCSRLLPSAAVNTKLETLTTQQMSTALQIRAQSKIWRSGPVEHVPVRARGWVGLHVDVA